MMTLGTIADGYQRWIDSVAGTVSSSLARFSSQRVVTLVENKCGELVLQENKQFADFSLPSGQLRISDDRLDNNGATPETTLLGCHVELILQPDRFLLRPLDLPARAAEFLDGVVRAQIDRLTPWNPDEAAFGWSDPVRDENDRIHVTVAAAPRASILTYLQALAGFGAHSVTVFTETPQEEHGGNRIEILQETPRRALDAVGIRRVLNVSLAGAAVAAGLLVGASTLFGGYVNSRQEEIAHRIASARAAVTAERGGKSSFALQRVLERRKHASPSTVVVLETLSQILPDDTYVTELRIDADMVRMSGVARNAPALIELMERSARFARATFVAPTTKSSSDPGERFHIEAQVLPVAPASL